MNVDTVDGPPGVMSTHLCVHMQMLFRISLWQSRDFHVWLFQHVLVAHCLVSTNLLLNTVYVRVSLLYDYEMFELGYVLLDHTHSDMLIGVGVASIVKSLQSGISHSFEVRSTYVCQATVLAGVNQEFVNIVMFTCNMCADVCIHNVMDVYKEV